MLFDLERKLIEAGDAYAIEWAKLEKFGYDPLELLDIEEIDPGEPWQYFLRARDRFLFLMKEMERTGRRIPVRYRIFLAGGCKENPGIVVPTLGIIALIALLACGLMSLLATGGTSVGQLQVAAGLSLIVALSWDRLWNALTYARIRLGR